MYEGPSLAHVFDFVAEGEEECRALAEEGSRRMAADVREFTPVGHNPFEEGYVPGHLLASIREKIVVVIPSWRGLIYEGGAETDVDYAVYVENGTGVWGPARAFYEIRPKNPEGWLRFHDEHGNVVFAKRVLHPGSPGAHMFARGAGKTEAEFGEWAGRRVEEWSRMREAQIQVRGREKVLIS